jgi:hypothetical protein
LNSAVPSAIAAIGVQQAAAAAAKKAAPAKKAAEAAIVAAEAAEAEAAAKASGVLAWDVPLTATRLLFPLLSKQAQCRICHRLLQFSKEGWQVWKNLEIDCCLLDIGIEHLDGWQTCCADYLPTSYGAQFTPRRGGGQ